MFGIGAPELILILVVGLIVFGPGKLPEMGRTLGKGLREFRKASNALTQAMNAPEPPPAPPQQAQPAQATEKTQAGTAASATATEASAAAAADANGAAKMAESQAYVPPTQESVRTQLAGQKTAEKKQDAPE
ncbi:twin-arginine translocase TatA/TatE family subunit [uncultured Mitsuokella sp.]|uniref:Sec-independent protein translocase subunit TatA/TatB n=1 Tax=uncultured Mitsuokella sp. TaxID=453120 RepID=UPI0026259671|nr:twin-arginine translocase TatA/TatE family subunit [uncultured Mitsuokella sp.]